MRSAIILAVGVTVVTAIHPALERLNKRDEKECASVAQEMLPGFTDIPSPTGALESFLATQTQFTSMADQCEFPAVTGSMASEYTAYASKLGSWYSDQKEGLSSLEKACSDVPEVMSEIDAVKKTGTICDKISWAKETGSSSSKDDNSKSDEKKDGNAAGSISIQAGIVVAIAGIAGVMML
ncbi:uncharacterized protein FTOL_11513 [Fusarium torulosum]|uniref:Infection structure specific protein n=1 Tax=Fusarium torulosum TaxID=33205 RepID=A0AAE8MKH8_9HYPO|nr:uncharacterized protein FTOL_11513 [Fusarium torulosum]